MTWMKKGGKMRFPLNLDKDYYTIKTPDNEFIVNEKMEIVKGLPVVDGLVSWYEDEYETRNGFVTKWLDKSGNGNHAEQTTEMRQPAKIDAGIQFDGVNQRLLTRDILHGLDDYTLLLVGDADGYRGNTGSLSGFASATDDSTHYYFNFNRDFLRVNAGATLNVLKYPLMASFAKGDRLIFTDITGGGVQSADKIDLNRMVRQGFGITPRRSLVFPTPGIVYASFLYDRVLTEDEQNAVYRYAKEKLQAKGVVI